MKEYNLGGFRHVFNVKSVLSERGCIGKNTHELMESIQARLVCLSLCLQSEVSVILNQIVSVCVSLSLSVRLSLSV